MERPHISIPNDAAPLLDGASVSLEVWTDGSTLKLFADGGLVVIFDLVFSDADSTSVALFRGSENPRIESLALHTVRATMSLQND